MDMGVLKQCLREEVAATASYAKDTESPSKVTPKSTQLTPGEEADKSGKPMNAHRLVTTSIIR